MKGFVLKGTVTLWLVAVIAMFFTACAKKSESQPAVTITAESYAKILNGDLSDFAGTWENVYNEKRQLKVDGFFADGLTVSNFQESDNGNGAYSWWIKIDEDERLGEMGEAIFLYPAGVELDIEGFSLEYSWDYSGVLLNDKTKDRIVVRPVPLYENLFFTAVYYREGQAPTVETLAAQRQTAASSNPHPEILNGDLSAFAGTWASSTGGGVILRPDGIFASLSTMDYWVEAGGFSRGVDSFSGSWASNGTDYHWNTYDEEGRYRGVVLFPVGVGVRYGDVDYPSDTTRVRIYTYQHDAYPINEYLYYREGEAPAAASSDRDDHNRSYAKILNGDFSAFAGTWVTGEGRTNPLSANGVFGSGNAYNFKEIDSGYFEWIVNWGGEASEVPIRLYPVGAEVFNTWTGRHVQTDTTKDRITVMDVVRNDEVYYQPDYHVQFKGETIYMTFTLLPLMSGNTKIGDILTYLNFSYEDKQQQIDLEYLGPISYTGLGSISISAGDYNSDGHMDLTLNGVIVLYNPQIKNYPTPNDPYANYFPQGSQ